LRLVRRFAAALLVGVPLGVAASIGGAGATVQNTTITSGPTAAPATVQFGSETTVVITTDVTGTLANGNPIGTLTVYSAPGGGGVVVCSTTQADTFPTSDSTEYKCNVSSDTLLGVGGSPYTLSAIYTPGNPSSSLIGAPGYNGSGPTSGGTLTITPIAVTVSSVLTPGSPYTAGGTQTDTATINSSVNATGNVTFTFYDGGTCVANVEVGGVARTPVVVAANGGSPGTASTNFVLPNTAGTTFAIVVGYSGDANNVAAATTCEGTFTTVKANDSISTTPSGPVTLGQPISDLIVISNLSGTNATGFVAVSAYNGACVVGNLVYTNAFNIGSFTSGTTATMVATFTPASTGTYNWVVNYPGDANNNAVSSGCTVEQSVVNPVAPPPPPPGPVLFIHPNQLADALRGHFYFQMLSATGGTPGYVFSLGGGALPPGLHLSANGMITGMAGAVGDYTFTVNVTDHSTPTAGFGTRTYTIDDDA